MRVLLYIPKGKEVEILKVEARMVWQEDFEEDYRIGAAFEKFAPGDERRIRQWADRARHRPRPHEGVAAC